MAFLSVTEAPDAVNRVHVDFACNRPLFNLDDQYVQYSAKCGLRHRLWTPLVFGLDSVVWALEFKFLALLLTIKPVSPIFALKQTSCLPFNS